MSATCYFAALNSTRNKVFKQKKKHIVYRKITFRVMILENIQFAITIKNLPCKFNQNFHGKFRVLKQSKLQSNFVY